MSIHDGDKAIKVIRKYGALKEVIDNEVGINYIIDDNESAEDVLKLWGNFRFPLANFTKLEMMEFYIKNGYKDVMSETWFCFNPIEDKPCGYCNPCNYSIEEGMVHRFNKKAIFRYKLNKLVPYGFLSRAISKIKLKN